MLTYIHTYIHTHTHTHTQGDEKYIPQIDPEPIKQRLRETLDLELLARYPH
jgi:hypothetical protein